MSAVLQEVEGGTLELTDVSRESKGGLYRAPKSVP